MKTVGGAMADHMAGGVTTVCHCWRLLRGDGVVLCFTDHDEEVVFNNETYSAASGFTASAIEDELGLAVSNLEAHGALISDKLTEGDLYTGLWDGAKITIYLVNWSSPDQAITLRSGTLGEVTRGKQTFMAELRGLAAALNQSTGRLFQRRCMWTLGDSRCTVDLNTGDHHGNGTVASVADDLHFSANGLGLADGMATRGKLVWTSGANKGTSVAIKSHSANSGGVTIALALPTPNPIAVGDAFTAYAGCDKTPDTCLNKFANIINFGGFPAMPGNDFILSFPRQGGDNSGGAL